MKKIIFLVVFISQINFAQNTFPLPSGDVGIGTTNPAGTLHLQKLNSNLVFDLNTNSLCKIVSKGWNANIDIHTFQINGIENLNQLHLNTNGNIGVGTDQPQAKFHIQGDLQNNGNILLGHMGDTNYLTSREVGQILAIRGSQEITFGTYTDNWYNRMIISNSGNVGIGTVSPTNKLDVNGTIHSKEVKVDMKDWSDFVFKKEYNLPTLEEVEKHI
ncbi:hypothetical protein [Flavobacterium anhuiense]|nr:hypothetical protein [Flavobacterium anhuiense]